MGCRAARRARTLLGRRGTALALFGIGKMAYGLSFLLHPEPDPRGLGLLTSVASIRCWAALWVICGAVTFACAWLRIGRDRWGFVAALVPPFVWGAAFLWGAVTDEYPRGVTMAAWFAAGHVGIILWAASVPEYEVPRPRTARQEHR
jgi:hypothetical protein